VTGALEDDFAIFGPAGGDEDGHGNGDAIRCAEWTREKGIDPIGTAGTYSGYLLVEWPLPWPADLGDIPELAPVVTALNGTGIRLQGLVGTSTLGPHRHVILYHRGPEGDGGFRGFVRHEELVAEEDVVSTCLQLLNGPTTVVRSDNLEPPLVDVLICGHGRRDRCCGSLGTRLFQQLAPLDHGHVRLWRTSHTGGHRFAPTLVVLPEATVWAFADEALVRQITTRSGRPEDLLGRYRGCSGLSSRRAQVVERAVFADLGWSLLGSVRSSEEAENSDVVHLRVDGPSGVTLWDARIAAGRTLAVPTCGLPIEQSTKTETELELIVLRRGHDETSSSSAPTR
jgi:hypothetical protein